MAVQMTGIDRLPATTRVAATEYATVCAGLFGSDTALTFFGAALLAAHADSGSARSRLHNVLVVPSISVDALRKLASLGPRQGGPGIEAPTVLTPDEIAGSLDTFSLELIEIQQCRVTVIGKDYFEELSFEPAHVRLQCERELKVARLKMIRGLLAAGGRERLIPDLLADVTEALVRTLRGLLWLKGHREPLPPQQIVHQVEQTVSVHLDGLEAALAAAADAGFDTYRGLHRDLSVLAQLVDTW